MSDTKAAAEQVRDDIEHLKRWKSLRCKPSPSFQHVVRVMESAAAYLAELDETPVTREFAESLGWDRKHVDDILFFEYGWWDLSFKDGKWSLTCSYSSVIDNPTCGQVRSLIRLMENM